MKKEDGSYGKTWHFGQRIETLKGTTRTLDMADGRVELEEGILAREGYTILDDSKSYLIRENGEIENRISEGLDIYFFHYILYISAEQSRRPCVKCRRDGELPDGRRNFGSTMGSPHPLPI